MVELCNFDVSLRNRLTTSQNVKSAKSRTTSRGRRKKSYDVTHLLARSRSISRLKLFRLRPDTPDTPKHPRAPSLLRSTTPTEPQTGLVLHQAQPAPAFCAIFRRRRLLRRESADGPPLYPIFLVSHELFVDCEFVLTTTNVIASLPDLSKFTVLCMD